MLRLIKGWPVAVIGSGHDGMAALINTLVEIATTHPSGAEVIKVLIVDRKRPQPDPGVPYPMNGISPDDLHPFNTSRPPSGFASYGQWLRRAVDASEEEGTAAEYFDGALDILTYGRVTAYLEYTMKLAMIAAGYKADVVINKASQRCQIGSTVRTREGRVRRRRSWLRPRHPSCCRETPSYGRLKLYVPVPESNTLSGTALALVAMLKVADRLFATVGLNLTLMLHDAPAANIGGQFSVIANDKGLVPVMPMLPIVNDVLPLLVSVAARAPLVAPTGTVPNLRLVGLTDAAGVTINVFDFLMPFAVPDMETVPLLRTLLVATSKGTDCRP